MKLLLRSMILSNISVCVCLLLLDFSVQSLSPSSRNDRTILIRQVQPPDHSNSCRRRFLAVASTAAAGALVASNPSHAAIKDETDRFADNWWSSSDDASASTLTLQKTADAPSDEVTIVVSKRSLLENKGFGIELADIEFRTNLRVYVKSVASNSYGSQLGFQKDWIVVGINGQSTERTNAQGVGQMIQQALQQRDGSDTMTLRFRDPSIFSDKLQSLRVDESVTTQVAPSGDTTQRIKSDGSVKPGRSVTSQDDQRITVTQLVAPKLCRHGATTDDLLEISYVGRLVENNQIFDGSAISIQGKGIPGRGDDVTIYFVLGKQPFGQFPPGWDVGLAGMCVGERRRLILPPALGFGAAGAPKRGIPPNAALQYDVTLVSLNGLSTPQ
jgi:FK506-binding protein 2